MSKDYEFFKHPEPPKSMILGVTFTLQQKLPPPRRNFWATMFHWKIWGRKPYVPPPTTYRMKADIICSGHFIIQGMSCLIHPGHPPLYVTGIKKGPNADNQTISVVAYVPMEEKHMQYLYTYRGQIVAFANAMSES